MTTSLENTNIVQARMFTVPQFCIENFYVLFRRLFGAAESGKEVKTTITTTWNSSECAENENKQRKP